MEKQVCIGILAAGATATTQLQTRALAQSNTVREKVNWGIHCPIGSPHQITTFITCLLWYMWQNHWVVPFSKILTSVIILWLVAWLVY